LLGLFALSQMDRLGPIHGYLLSERIAEQTDGAWRPGAGAVYPALTRLTRRGLVRSRMEGRRRVYMITSQGRKMLTQFRSRNGSWASHRPDLSTLWAEVWGMEDAGAFLLLRLRRSLEAIEVALAAPTSARRESAGLDSLRADVIAELSGRLEQLRRNRPPIRTRRTRASARGTP